MKLSLAVIAANETEFLDQFFRGVSGFVDEIVFVDTGSSDDTPERAHQHGANVFHFAWRDDFSAARNFSLSQCTGDWILVLDCDELIAPRDFQQLRWLLHDKNTCHALKQRHYTNNSAAEGFRPLNREYPELEPRAAGFFESSMGRLFPRRPDVFFSGRVHESIEHSVAQVPTLQLKNTPIIIHHWGFLRNDRAEKKQFYARLAEEKIIEEQSSWKVWFELGIAQLEARNLPASVQAFRRSIQLRRDFVPSWTNLAYVLTELNQYREAEQVLFEALKLTEFSAEAFNNLGVIYLRTGFVAHAEQCFCRAVELHPWDVNALSNLGKARMRLGKLNDAEQALREALELSPEESEIKIDLGFLLCSLNRFEEAASFLQEATEKAPTATRAHYHLSTALKHLGDVSGALRELEIFCAIESELQKISPLRSSAAALARAREECNALRLMVAVTDLTDDSHSPEQSSPAARRR